MSEANALEKAAIGIVETAVADNQSTEGLTEFYFLLGGIDTANAIATNLNAAVIANLQRIRDDRLYAALGYTRFDAFLDEHPRSPMKYKRFNYLEGVITTLGSQKFDLLYGSGISMRTMKLLAAGDIDVEGDEVVIGGEERVPIGHSRALKAIVEQLVNDKRVVASELDKAEATIDKQASQLRNGQDEYERLQRRVDELRQGDPHDRALADAVFAFRELEESIGQMSDEDKAAKAGNAVRTLFQQLQMVRKSYGVNVGYDDGGEPLAVSGQQSANDLVKQVLAEDDDFGDDTEVAE